MTTELETKRVSPFKGHKHTNETRQKMRLSRGHNTNGCGRFVNTNGYVKIWLQSDDFFYPMSEKNGYVYEHRLVMAKNLGRCLDDIEAVHHKNGIRTDNDIHNLEMCATMGEHSVLHTKGYRDGYERGYSDGKDRRIKELEAYVEKLKGADNVCRVS